MAASSRSTAPRLGRCCSCSGGPGGRIAHRVLRGADNPSIISANLNPRNGEAVRTKLNVTIRRQALWQDDYRRPDGRAGQAPARTAARTLSGPVVEAWGDVSAPPLSIASSRGPRGASQRAETVSTERRNGSWSERTRPPPRGRNKNAGFGENHEPTHATRGSGEAVSTILALGFLLGPARVAHAVAVPAHVSCRHSYYSWS